MTPEIAADVINEALHLIMLLVGVMVLPALIVGLLVSLFQAATQINEQTLSFLPRLMVMLLMISVAGHWLFTSLMDFCIHIFERAATLVG